MKNKLILAITFVLVLTLFSCADPGSEIPSGTTEITVLTTPDSESGDTDTEDPVTPSESQTESDDPEDDTEEGEESDGDTTKDELKAEDTTKKSGSKSTDKGTDTTKKSADTTKKSADTTKKSADTTKKSADTTKKSADTTKKSADTTKKSADTTKKSQDTTKRPADTTKPPVETTTQTPVTTEAPEPPTPPAGPAPSYPIINPNRKHSSSADYNNKNVNIKQIKSGRVILPSSHNIHIGENDFMFYGTSISVYTGEGEKGMITSARLKKLATNLTTRDSWAKENGIDLYFVIAPNKASVYGDYINTGVLPADKTRTDMIVEYLAENTSCKVIDLRKTVKDARSTFGDKLFYKYDTHWTQDAGFVAYSAIMDQVRAASPNAVKYTKNDFNVETYETYMKDMLYYAGQYDSFTDYGSVYSLKVGPAAEMTMKTGHQSTGEYVFAYLWPDGYKDDLTFFRFQSKNTSAPKLFMYRDSFAIALVPFFKESFSESTFKWSTNFSKSEILESGANVVIIEVTEDGIDEVIGSRPISN